MFFFFKQKTAYEMRISDWSSDVCSSDLRITKERARRRHVDDRAAVALVHQRNGVLAAEENALAHDRVDPAELLKAAFLDIGHRDHAFTVHEDVEAAEALLALAHNVDPRLFRCDVDCTRDRVPADPPADALPHAPPDTGLAHPNPY